MLIVFLISINLKVMLIPLFMRKMAYEVYGILYSNVHPVSGETYETAAPDDEAFLRNVITPIYQVLRKVFQCNPLFVLFITSSFLCMLWKMILFHVKKESKRNKGGTASHSRWRNYDDLNEYFW